MCKYVTALWEMIQGIETVDKNVFRNIEKKLEICRSQVNNPDSQEYRRAMQEAFGGDEERKYAHGGRSSEDHQ